MINPEDFMNTTVEGSNSTEEIAVPDDEYLAVVKSVKVRTPKESVILDVTWEIDDADGKLKELTGRDSNTVRQSVFLDIAENGQLDMSKGRNAQLGRLREAVGMNEGAFSFGMLEGQVAKIRTAQRIYEGSTFVDVKAVAKA